MAEGEEMEIVEVDNYNSFLDSLVRCLRPGTEFQLSVQTDKGISDRGSGRENCQRVYSFSVKDDAGERKGLTYVQRGLSFDSEREVSDGEHSRQGCLHTLDQRLGLEYHLGNIERVDTKNNTFFVPFKPLRYDSKMTSFYVFGGKLTPSDQIRAQLGESPQDCYGDFS